MILERAQRFERERALDRESIRQVVDRAVRAEPGMPMGEALLEIARLGQRAVPVLVEFLTGGPTEATRVNAAYILAHLGREAGYPLSRCLEAEDDVVVQHVCSVLVDLKPPETRAVPFLKALAEDSGRAQAVRLWAGRALEAITGRDAAGLPPAAELFREEANRYYLEDDVTSEEVDRMRGVLWIWAPEAGGSDTPRLRAVEVPRFTLDDLLARELTLRGMALAPEEGPLQVLLASVLLQQTREAATVDAILELQGMRVEGLDAMESAVTEWTTRVERNPRLAWTVGPDALGAVVTKSLRDGKAPVAVAALEAIERTLPANALLGGQAVESLVQALESGDAEVRTAAANCLARIGLPAGHAAFQDAVDALVDGARMQSDQIALLISNDSELRERVRSGLEERGVQTASSTDGALGAAQATRFPPKDGIFLDAELAEFSQVRRALALVGLVSGSPLPLVVIAPPERVDPLRDGLESANYNVAVRMNVAPGTQDLYESLAGEATGVGPRQAVLLVNGNVEERRELKQAILVAAERANRVGERSALSEALGRERGADDIFAVRPTSVNVFLSDELGGFHAMRTLQELRQDPRSRHVPVTLLVPPAMMADAERRFADFLNDPAAKVSLLSAKADDEAVFTAMSEMTEANPVSQQNYTRQTAYRMALRSARGLAGLAARAPVALSGTQVDALREVVADRARPVQVRTGVARILGLAGATRAAPTLAMVFREEPVAHHGLRVACLEALGLVDRANEYGDVKRSALNENDLVIQQRAAAALALANLGRADRAAILAEEMPADPKALLRGVAAAPPPPVGADTPAPTPREVLDAPIDSNIFEMAPAGVSSGSMSGTEGAASAESSAEGDAESASGEGFMEAPAE
jgi:CheY-like chemotaxis protein